MSSGGASNARGALLARLLLVAGGGPLVLLACGDSADPGAGAGAAGGNSSAECQGKNNPKPARWTSTERSPSYECGCDSSGVQCCANHDQCFTRADLAGRTGLAGAGGAADGTAERCPRPEEFVSDNSYAVCLGIRPIAQLPDAGALCCYTFAPGDCCGRPLLTQDGVRRLATLRFAEDWVEPVRAG